MTACLHSSLFEGWVRHRRHAPVLHRFRYRLFMAYLDLDEIDELAERRWLFSAKRGVLAVFRRRDHLGPEAQPLREAVADLVEEQSGRRPSGPIRLLTQLACFGHRFNPVSFYYCFDPTGNQVEHVVAEINNTPWGEQFCYVLDVPKDKRLQEMRFGFAKRFHISPFLPMEHSYRWRFTPPEDRLAVHMTNIDADGQEAFDASLSLKRRPLTSPQLGLALLRFPLMTVQVMAAIYWQAFRLWSKRCPTFPHPGPRNHSRTRQMTAV